MFLNEIYIIENLENMYSIFLFFELIRSVVVTKAVSVDTSGSPVGPPKHFYWI
jgi:hypothetical protein